MLTTLKAINKPKKKAEINVFLLQFSVSLLCRCRQGKFHSDCLWIFDFDVFEEKVEIRRPHVDLLTFLLSVNIRYWALGTPNESRFIPNEKRWLITLCIVFIVVAGVDWNRFSSMWSTIKTVKPKNILAWSHWPNNKTNHLNLFNMRFVFVYVAESMTDGYIFWILYWIESVR